MTTREETRVAAHSLFISYGREDASSFVKRLALDLRALNRDVYWIDLEHIAAGERFDVAIERGIRRSDAVAAVVTRRSVEDDSICRDEIVLAFNERKRIVPVRIVNDVDFKLPLLLARRNWIDFAEDYGRGLHALVRFLDGDESQLHAPELPSITGVIPLDFTPELAKYCLGFVGRQWLVDEIDAWLDRPNSSVFAIVGEPGIGKSSISAWLSVTRKDVLCAYYCTEHNSRTRKPEEFVAAIVGQLTQRLPHYAAALVSKRPDLRRPMASDAFRELVVETLLPPFPAPTESQLVVIDALDEAMAQEGDTIINILMQHLPDLPKWLRFVVTSRPEAAVLQFIRQFQILELTAQRPENCDDLHHMIAARVARDPVAASDSNAVEGYCQHIESLAAGNFLHAHLTMLSVEQGIFDRAELGDLSPGLAAFFSRLFDRRFGRDEAEWNHNFDELLSIFAVIRQPISFELLRSLTKVSAKILHRRLLTLQPLLHNSVDCTCETYSLFHKSLSDWLTDRTTAGRYWIDSQAAHALLADRLPALASADKSPSSEYAWSSLTYHLFAAGEHSRLVETIGEPFLVAKARREGFAVLEDIEFVTRAIIEQEDPKLVERCVRLVETVRNAAGDALVDIPRRSGATTFASNAGDAGRTIEPLCEVSDAVDCYVGMLPRGMIGADFVETVSSHKKLFVAIGDAPGAGLKSAFVARFMGHLFRRHVAGMRAVDMGNVIAQMNRTISPYEYFESMSMQCICIDRAIGLATIANAGHIPCIRYSARHSCCERLPVRGVSLPTAPADCEQPWWRQRQIEIEPGDVFVLLSDGLSEGSYLHADAYGYRFVEVVTSHAQLPAREIGRRIIHDWQRHTQQRQYLDDTSIVVIKICPEA